MSKKKEPEKVVETLEEVETFPRVYVSYTVKLGGKLEGYTKGKILNGTFMPVLVDHKNKIWEDKWFLYDGEKLIGIFPNNGECPIIIVSTKKARK